MNKKIISMFLAFLFICFVSFPVNANVIGISAQSAVLMCVNNDEVLYSKNEDKKLPMASTTKIMTSLLALEAATPEREIIVTDEMVNVEGTSMGLKAGDSVSLCELVYGMMLQSGNDAANTVAYVIGGNPVKFSEMMNERASEIGMTNSNFVTPSGLDAEGHYSTAYDMALLASKCIMNPEFRHICSQKSAKLTYGNPPYLRTLTNHNRLLWKYSDSIGIKTGFTKKSGRCLVSAAERNGVILVAVTLNAADDWNDHISLFEYGFSKCKPVLIGCDLSSVKLNVVGGAKKHVPVRLMNDFVSVEGQSCYFRILMKNFEYAPVKKGEIAGIAEVVSDGKIIDRIPILTDGVSLRTVYISSEKEDDKKESLFSVFRKRFFE